MCALDMLLVQHTSSQLRHSTRTDGTRRDLHGRIPNVSIVEGGLQEHRVTSRSPTWWLRRRGCGWRGDAPETSNIPMFYYRPLGVFEGQVSPGFCRQRSISHHPRRWSETFVWSDIVAVPPLVAFPGVPES